MKILFIVGIAGVLICILFYAPHYLTYSDKPRSSDAVVLLVGPDFEARKKEANYLIGYGYANFLIIPAYGRISKAAKDGTLKSVKKNRAKRKNPSRNDRAAKSAQKIYIIDNGFIKARSFEVSPNYGRLLENIVFIELLRRDYKPELDLFYYRTRNDREIDFLVRKGHRIEQLIQVCYDMEQPKVRKREIDALLEAAKELNCTDLLLITWEKEDLIEIDQLKIKLLPAYKWLLNR